MLQESGFKRVGVCSNGYECARVALSISPYDQDATVQLVSFNSHGSGCNGNDIAGWLMGGQHSVWVVTDAAWKAPQGITLYGAVAKNDYYKRINTF